jgi:hypothetical protein
MPNAQDHMAMYKRIGIDLSCVNTDVGQPLFIAFGSALQGAPAHNYLILHGSIAGTFIPYRDRARRP